MNHRPSRNTTPLTQLFLLYNLLGRCITVIFELYHRKKEKLDEITFYKR